MEQVLIVEDDKGLNQGLCRALKTNNRQIFSCYDLKTAREQLLCGSVSLVLLDVNLSDGSGLSLLQEIKENTPDTPVILLTANDTDMDMDIVDGLERGADDYITKPFSLSVLRARVNTQLRKKIPIHVNTPIHIDHFCFDFDTMTFYVGNDKVELSKTEQKLLHLLIANRGQTLVRGDLVSQSALMEGLDESLFDKVTGIEGDLSPLFQKDTNAIAILCTTDDYGNAEHLDFYPPLGSVQTITYIDEESSHDVDYTVCAYVTVPYSMSFRYYTTGYSFVLPIEKLNYDSRHESVPMFYLFDTPDTIAESSAEDYLADLTTNDLSGLVYESKATIRSEFEGFQHIFLLFGGLLCAIIWLVGILNFFNAILTGIFSRKREFAVLQAVGMTGKQLKSMLVYEGLFYTLAAALGAALLSLAINPLIGCLLENMFWFFSAKFTILPVIFTLPLFALLGWLIPSLMYSCTDKYSIVEQLQENH